MKSSAMASDKVIPKVKNYFSKKYRLYEKKNETKKGKKSFFAIIAFSNNGAMDGIST